MDDKEAASCSVGPGGEADSSLEAHNKVEDASENNANTSINQHSIRDTEESRLSNTGSEVEVDQAYPDLKALDDAGNEDEPTDNNLDSPIGMDVDSNNLSSGGVDDARAVVDLSKFGKDDFMEAGTDNDPSNIDSYGLVKTEPGIDKANLDPDRLHTAGPFIDPSNLDSESLYNTGTESDSTSLNPDSINPDGPNSLDTEADLFGLKPSEDNTKVVIMMSKDSPLASRYKPDTSNYKHKCELCSEVFQWPHKLKRHVGIVHEGRYPFHCDICNKPFDRKSSLADHQMVHTDAKPYECVECDKSFKFKGNLRKHVRETHLNKDLSFECQHCHKVFSNKEKLHAHFVVHSEVKSFFCDVCGKGFLRKHNLREHEIIHKDEKNFECTECGMKFNRKYSLKIHARNHMAVKPYQCALCPSSFSQLHALKNHIRLHTGERPYECRFCSRSFAQMGTLQAHEKRHTGEKDFKCGVCGVGFVLKRRLEEHMRTHTKEKPFECDLCPYRASTTSGLRYHKQNHLKRIERDAELGEVEGIERAQPVIDDGDLRRSRYRKVNAMTNNVGKKKRGRPKSEKSEMLAYYDIKSSGRKCKNENGDGKMRNGRGRGKRSKNSEDVSQVGAIKSEMGVLSNGGTEENKAFHAMLANALPSLDLNQLKNIPAASNFPIDKKLIQYSIDKVVGDLAHVGDTISRFSSLNKATPPMDVNLLQSNIAASMMQNNLSSSDTQQNFDEDSNSAENEVEGSENGGEEDNVESGDADDDFVVQINNDYDAETEDEAEQEEEEGDSNMNGFEEAESNGADNVLVETKS